MVKPERLQKQCNTYTEHAPCMLDN